MSAGLRSEVVAVDRIAAVGGKRYTLASLVVGGAWLCELACHATHLDDRKAGAIHQHNCHLQHSLDAVSNSIRGGIREGLRAVTTLQQEGLPCGSLSQSLTKSVDLAGTD